MIPFPIIADRSGDIARAYGMLPAGVNQTQTVRTVFFIDPEGIVRASLNYPLTNGRCIAEILRLLKALQTTDSTHMVTPACWQDGDPLVYPPPATVDAALAAESNPDKYCVDWYLCYDKPPILPAKGSGQY